MVGAVTSFGFVPITVAGPLRHCTEFPFIVCNLYSIVFLILYPLDEFVHRQHRFLRANASNVSNDFDEE